MTWRRLGLLLPAPPACGWATSHAGIPVPVPRQDGTVRLYFSARDGLGRSRIGSADVDLHDPSAPPRFSTDVVIGLGALGAYDDSGVTTSCVVEHRGTQYQYFSGWSLGQTVPFYFYVGCAVSDDGGETWQKVSRAPILGRTDVDPFLTASPWVLVEDGLWRMWYVSGTGWSDLGGTVRHRYHIKYAESRNGIEWTRDGTVCIDYTDEREYAIARPCVIRDKDCYRMWFCSRGDTYRLGYAESADGVTWERSDTSVIDLGPEGAFDSEMQAYPAVLEAAGNWWLLYNGNGYGRTGIGYALLED